MIREHFDKNNLHHAYLIEGVRNEVASEIIEFLKDSGIKTIGNPDFTQISVDNFKIDEAFDLRSMSADRGFSTTKKIFLICVNSFSLDAENVLLKMFEEPIENTHFFLVVPDINALLKTFVSRFYLISTKSNLTMETKEAEKFITMSLKKRIDFIKELLAETEEEDEKGNEIILLDSTRSKALKFLNAVEFVLHSKQIKNNPSSFYLEHFFKVREFLRMPGSSTKSLMESVALIVPEKI